MGEAEAEAEAESEADATLKEEEGGGKTENQSMAKSRKEKRKEMKKMKRKQLRKEVAEKEREAEEAMLNDPDEQKRIAREEEEERKRREIVLKEFEERERAWIQAMDIKRKAQEEEENKRDEDANGEETKQDDSDDDWEYVEEGPAEIIWQGNEIIVRKKKVRVPKAEANQNSKEEDADRPISNPLPPQSEAFADYLNATSAQQVLESVAREVPNFGTEQDKAHCPFHLKTGACRFGQRCSRVHFYPDKSCTLLIRNMYNGPGLAWEQDEGLEYTDEEVERCYEEFYEDVHTEFLKFGEIVNFKVCKNGSFHLRGNVYVHYKLLESAVLAYDSINGRYFAGRQVTCEFVNITRWKVAICGEFMKSRFKTCSHGTACNFIHCFRNPGGDYEWADWDKPPPRYWVKKMVALFGYSDEGRFEKHVEEDHNRSWRESDDDRRRSRRSKSRETIRPNKEGDVEEISLNNQRKNVDGRSDRVSRSLKWQYLGDDRNIEERENLHRRKGGYPDDDGDGGETHRSHKSKSSRRQSSRDDHGNDNYGTHERDKGRHHRRKPKSKGKRERHSRHRYEVTASSEDDKRHDEKKAKRDS